MSQLSISSIAAIAAVVFLVYRFIISPLFLSPLSKIPSAHFTSHLCPLWIYWIRDRNIENRTMYDLHKLKGAILRTAPSQLSVNCYEGGLKTIYTGGFHETDFYHNRFIKYGVDPMFAMSGAAHSARKRMLSHVYAKSYILSNPTAATSGAALEVLEILASYSMDAFMTFQFGLKLGSNFLHNKEERKWYLHTFYVRRPYLFWMTELPKFTNFMKKTGFPLVPKWVDQATFDLEDWQMRICDNAEKLLSDGSEIDVKDVPLVYKHEGAAFIKQDGEKGPLNGQAYPRRLEIASDMYDHNAAAHETSGKTLCYLFYELSRRPDLQDKLREELRSLSPPLHYPSTPGDNGESLPDSKAVDQLPFLDAIAVPGGQPRVTPEPSCSLAGYDNIPPGVRVQSSGFAIHRDPNVFPEPNEWIPERWLNQTPEKLSEM
ncbi:unnamed protein product [Clonostachys chloroleuca]|uniref:Cytochrome P450 n=1 Tax=Clonostachys chloroleuca TaxID=1926264 RepID=A0AA35Q7R5_9HYPO|nr:unnamed protein product [Clonostachys chloroleuca]